MTANPDLTESLVQVRPARAGVVIAEVTGELDFLVTSAVRRRLVEASGPGVHLLVVDLDDVALLSAAAIAMLVEVVRLAADRGTEVRFVATSRFVLRPLTITGDDRWLPMYPSQADALGA